MNKTLPSAPDPVIVLCGAGRCSSRDRTRSEVSSSTEHRRRTGSFERFGKMAYTINQMFHSAMFLMYAFTVYRVFILTIPELITPFKKFDAGMLKYLTIWNLIIQAVYFFICLLNDLFGTNAANVKKSPFIRKFKDYMHAVLSFPIAMFVGITFWSLMFIDRELVFPKFLDAYFPMWLNHLMHTIIMFTSVAETLITPRTYPKRSKGLLGHFMFLLIYLIWMHIIYIKSGVWVYPVMEVLTLPLRILFFLTLLAFSTTLYIIGESLDNLVWGTTVTAGKSAKKKKKKLQ